VASSSSLVDAVDPFIGTGGHGHTYPGATVPFGMVQLSPDTRLSGWDGCSGYHFSDDVVYGFSHTHLSGTGVSDYGDALFMPGVGQAYLDNGATAGVDHGYASRFDKAREEASPGYYATWLSDSGISVELTATPRAGLQRYRFPPGRDAHVILDLQHRDRVVDAQILLAGDATILGWRRSSAWARDQIVYFAAQASRPFEAELALDDVVVAGVDSVRGTNSKAVLSFGSDAGEVMLRVGLSSVDVAGALHNLEQEIPDFDFDATHAAARAAWAAALDRFEVDGASHDERTIFATALYHSFLAPNLFSDVDGRYRGMDGEAHRARGRRHYTVFSLWDTYRATHPLFTIVEPERTREFLQTFLAQYQQGGRLPVWELAANETDCMIGYHSVSVIADAWTKGITTSDGPALLDAMLDSARRQHFGLGAYQRDGYIATDEEAESVSKTLEYAYDDWCIARMAHALGETALAATFERRAQAWRHLFDPATRFLRPRDNGGWLTPYDPRRVDFHHTEANGWQYRFAVPHDVTSFIEALGGDDAFIAALDSLFEIDSATTGREQADITGRIGQYAHGNEPSHHVAWLYHYAGRPDRSAERVDHIRRAFYTARPDGLIGNEDCGQMSSWYVFAALGLYPVAPGNGEYVIVPPQFRAVRLRLESGRTLTIRREGEGPYVQSVRWNGQELRRSWISHAELVGGSELVVRVGEHPSAWGRAAAQRPHSRIQGPAIVPAPWIESTSASFRDSLQLRAGSADVEATYSWRAGTRRGEGSRFVVYETGPVVLTATGSDGRQSPRVRARFWRIPNDWTVSVESVPNPQYTAGGPQALVDGRRGALEWRTGAWQGYQGQDFVAVVDFGEVQTLTGAGAGFLQDQRSWILMPTEVVFETSIDGTRFTELGHARHDIDDQLPEVLVEDLHVSFDKPTAARFLRVHAVNYGTLPDWHLGAGGEAFIFVDEIFATTRP
jgi:predicted alpha-1,2-mannosidase